MKYTPRRWPRAPSAGRPPGPSLKLVANRGSTRLRSGALGLPADQTSAGGAAAGTLAGASAARPGPGAGFGSTGAGVGAGAGAGPGLGAGWGLTSLWPAENRPWLARTVSHTPRPMRTAATLTSARTAPRGTLRRSARRRLLG